MSFFLFPGYTNYNKLEYIYIYHDMDKNVSYLNISDVTGIIVPEML